MGVFLCLPGVFSSRDNFPNSRFVPAVAVLVILLPCACRVNAQLVINELYYDHPGSDGGHEFVEIMNVSDAAVSLAAVSIGFHNGTGIGWETLWAGSPGEVAPGELYLVGGADVTPVPDAVAGFSLQNGPDALRLTVAGVQCDLVAYGGLDDADYAEGVSAPSVPAGRSLARKPDGGDSGDNSADFAEAAPSPGAFNVPRCDAEIVTSGATGLAAVLPEHGFEDLLLGLGNNGLNDIAPGSIDVEVWDSTGTSNVPAGNATNAESIPPGGRTTLSVTVSLAPGYHWLLARLAYVGDERANNDSIVLLRRVGGPELLISEVLCYPADDCPQFVEVFNAGDRAVDIAGFKLRDKSHALSPITRRTAAISPGGFIVVTERAEALIRCFPAAPAARVVEHSGTWPTLNRTGSGGVSDSVVLADALSLPVDAIGYPPVGSDYKGKSLERVDLFPGCSSPTWVLSRDPSGATPGRPNDRSLLAAPAPGSVEVKPRTFSPFAGEAITVSVDADAGFRAVVGVHDAEGRRLTELGSSVAFPAVFVWDGRDAHGRLLAPGIYVVVCELYAPTGGRAAARKVVVGCGRRGG
jgi:hypothetical protein